MYFFSHLITIFRLFKVLLARKSRQTNRRITVLRLLSAPASPVPTSTSDAASTSPPNSETKADVIAPAAAGLTMAKLAGSAFAKDSAKKITISVPAGKLGMVLDDPEEGGSAYVSEVKETCPVKDQIRVGDRVVAVDNDDVSEKKAVDISSEL